MITIIWQNVENINRIDGEQALRTTSVFMFCRMHLLIMELGIRQVTLNQLLRRRMLH
jgi:hypothetical protein